MVYDTTLYAILVLIALLLFKAVTSLRKSKGPLPPGPRGYPIIGNLFDITEGLGYDPSNWAKHKKQYGPISSVSAFGNNIIALNEMKTAVDLLDKRSTTYSNRPSLVFCGEMIGWERNVTMLQYDDDRFRTTRKYMSRIIGSKDAVKQFNPILELESRRLLACILETPEKLKLHIGKWAGASILRIAYGYNVKRDGEDPLVQKIERVIRQTSLAGKPGAWLVDTLPFLRYLPDWFPGTGFKRTAREWREGLIETLDKPWEFVKGQIAAGIAPDSFTSNLLRESLSQEDETVVKWSAHAFYAAGSDTTVSTLHGFFLAMLLFPDVQKKAQAELDSVVGNDRLPCLQDRDYLPYINAIVKEILRWTKTVALGLPHIAAEDGMYEGYFIPNGSVLIPNIWLFNHDPDNFPDPMVFKPERFLDVDGKKPSILDPFDISFGFGRRICPGKEFASSALFIAIAMSLSTFEILKANDEKGMEIVPPMEWTTEVLSHPVEFKCNMKSRSNKAKILMESVNEEYLLPQSDVF